MPDLDYYASTLNPHSAPSPEKDRPGLFVPVRIDLAKGDLEVLERIATLLEERRVEDARALRRSWWIAGLAVLDAILSLVVLALLAMGRWT